jgi:hypothetical protein
VESRRRQEDSGGRDHPLPDSLLESRRQRAEGLFKFDSSAKNKFNPDPTMSVRYGEPTYDEMMMGFVEYVTEKPKQLARIDPQVFDTYAGKYDVGNNRSQRAIVNQALLQYCPLLGLEVPGSGRFMSRFRDTLSNKFTVFIN